MSLQASETGSGAEAAKQNNFSCRDEKPFTSRKLHAGNLRRDKAHYREVKISKRVFFLPSRVCARPLTIDDGLFMNAF